MTTNTLAMKNCPKCGAALSYTSYEGYCAYADCLWNNDDDCSPPADPGSAAVVAHASESSSGVSIPPTLEQFQRWLETRAHNSAAVIAATEPHFSWSGDVYLDHSLVVAECRVATSLLMQFKSEQCA